MPKLAIDKGFLKDMGKLEKGVYNRVIEVFDEFDAATHTGLHLEKIANARNPRFRSIRIDQAWRGIVLAPVRGEVYTLLKVLHHDDAYAWAQRSNVSVNAATGGIEVRDEEELGRQLPQMQESAKTAATLLFAHVSDGELTKLGIDDTVMAFARTVTDTAQIDSAKGFLPETQWDVLFGLAAGYTPEEVWADLGAEILDEPVDTDDLDAAVLRSRDRVLLVDGPDELMEVFSYPLDLWRVYLHPTQRAIVEARYDGPSRVTGGPGTGKTVVALHRAHALARRGEGQILLTTFTSTLNNTLQFALDTIVSDDDVEKRIEVIHVDKLASRVFRREHRAPDLLSSDQETALWGEVVDHCGLTHAPVVLADEWRTVVLARQITTLDDYLAAKHKGLGRPLRHDEQEKLWRAITEFERQLKRRGVWTHETIRREATAILEAKTTKPYRHVVIDEAQDLSPDQWRLLRAAVAEAPDDIFIAGDTHQRIYDNHVTLRDVGIYLSDRSTPLSLNYRTTAEVLGWSLGLLRGERIDDMDGGLDSIAGCKSYIRGEPPRMAGFDNSNEEAQFVADSVEKWIAKGVAPCEIGIATRTKWFGSMIQKVLTSRRLPTVDLAQALTNDQAISIGTMHRMKGLEFRCVVVAGVGEKMIPEANAITPIDEDKYAHDQDIEREKCLLFVACTRAREQLLVTWHGRPSTFLGALGSDSSAASFD